jgi:hypothetical protein
MTSKLLASVTLALLLVAGSAHAAPPGWSKCKHYDGTVILVQGHTCPAGFIKQY